MFKKYILLLLSCIFVSNALAKDINFDKIFNNKTGCFILYDLTTNKSVISYGEKQCATRMSPCSTFKIPLALMAFDQRIFKNKDEIIKWDGVDRGITKTNWNKDQTPRTWLQYSTVWVSQWLTPQLGVGKITSYLDDFKYGNKDISAGITKFWLCASLKISGDEQLNFLKRLWQNQLAISDFAIRATKKALYSEKSEIGSVMYSKTGSGFINVSNRNDGKIGWLVGYLSYDNHNYVFVTNFTSKENFKISEGQEAGDIAKQIIHELGLW